MKPIRLPGLDAAALAVCRRDFENPAFSPSGEADFPRRILLSDRLLGF